MVLEKEIEIVDLPKRGGEFKVIQLLVDEFPVMLCGYTYHSEILEGYLRKKNIGYETKTVRELFEEVEIPLECGEQYRVLGMGYCKIFPDSKVLQLPYGSSHAYKISTDYQFREKLREQFKNWEIKN